MQMRPIDSVAPYGKNAKQHPKKQVEQIAASIKAFGFNQPVVTDKEGVIIVGHGRYEAAKLMGLKEIPVLEVDLPDGKVKAYRLADNKLNESKWEMDLVIDELNLLTDELLQLTGFTRLDINREEWKRVEKRSLAEDFIIPPFSYWDTRQAYWQDRKRRWKEFFGDSREGRDDDLIGEGLGNLAKLMGSDTLTGTSEFDPVVAEICYKWFVPPNGKILDPFAGGVVRGAVAGTLDYEYTGIDLSRVQIAANKEALARIDTEIKQPTYVEGDSSTLEKLLPKDEQYDFIFSCPPYYDLEVYSDDKDDLSNKDTYEEFKDIYTKAITKAVNRLKDNRFAVFVVGDIRDKEGFYRGFVRDTVEAFEHAGAKLYNDIVLVNSIATASLRSRRPFDSARKVTKVHQNVLAFYKGDPKEISNAYIALPKVERMHTSVVVFYKGDIDEIKANYKVVHTELDM